MWVGRDSPTMNRATMIKTTNSESTRKAGYWMATCVLCKGSRFATALRGFAHRYADQNERDHAQLERAIAAGAVESAPGG